MNASSILRQRPWLAVLAVPVGVLAMLGWGWLGAPVIVPPLLTMEADASDSYDVRLPTPLIIDDDRDLYAVTQNLHSGELERLQAVDLRDSFMLVARSEVCAPYLRDHRLMLGDSDWWIGERPEKADITDLYNLCETELVDFHVFAVDREHIDAFDDVTRARLAPR